MSERLTDDHVNRAWSFTGVPHGAPGSCARWSNGVPRTVQAATAVRLDHEELLFHRLLPGMRGQVGAACKQKEGAIGYFFGSGAPDAALPEFLGDNGHC